MATMAQGGPEARLHELGIIFAGAASEPGGNYLSAKTLGQRGSISPA